MRVNESYSTEVKASQFNEYLGELSKDKWVIYNYRSGAMLDLSKKLYDAVKKSEAEVIENKDIVQTLQRCNFYVPSGMSEHEDFFAEKRRYVDEEKVIGLQILPTMNCNFRCTYCYEGLDSKLKLMSDEIIETIYENVKSRIKPTTQFLNISWFGGEPLMAASQIDKLSKKLLKLAEEHNLVYNGFIVTNGYLLNDKNIDMIHRNKITSCQVTIDGTKKFHDKTRVLSNGAGTWDVVMNNTVKAVEKGVKMNVRINLDKDNVTEIDEFILELHKRGILNKIELSFSIVQVMGQTCKSVSHNTLSVEEADRIIKSKKLTGDFIEKANSQNLGRVMPDMFGCVATAAKSLIVGPDGELYKCSKVVGAEDMICGNIKSPDYSNKEFRRWVDHNNSKVDKCTACRFLPICVGMGCAYDKLVENKDIYDCSIDEMYQLHGERLKELFLRKQTV